jgi:hypothetical protein
MLATLRKVLIPICTILRIGGELRKWHYTYGRFIILSVNLWYTAPIEQYILSFSLDHYAVAAIIHTIEDFEKPN